MPAPSRRTLQRKVRYILKHAVEKDRFIEELARSSLKAAADGDLDDFAELIADWYATAEIDAIPGMRKKTLALHKRVKRNGIPKSWPRYEAPTT